MCSIKMYVCTSLLLLAVCAVATSLSQAPKCLNGQVQRGTNNLLQYCYIGEWRLICYLDSGWDNVRTTAACKQLGFGNGGTGDVQGQSTALRVVTLTNCTGPELTQCTVTPSESCNIFVSLMCSTAAHCTLGEIRLANGSTEREGRVEVCVTEQSITRWRTVCTNNSQQLAGTVCAKMGYIFEGGTVAAVDTYPRGEFPEHTLNCVLTEGNCQAVEAQCSSAVEFGVVCKSYKDLYNECSMDSMPSTGVGLTTQSISCTPDKAITDSSKDAGIGILAALLVAVTVGWILSCIVLLRTRKTGLKQQHESAQISTVPGIQRYSTHQDDDDKHTYNQTIVDDNSYNRLNRGPTQSYTIGDATYDYANHTQIKAVSSPASDHPPPVGGVSEDQFYNAEDHTYAAINKGTKKKQSVGKEEKENPLMGDN